MSGNQNSIGVCYLPPRAVATGSPTGDALENIISFDLGDGALCFVSTGAGAGGWQFEVAGTGVPDGTTTVQPIAGPGRWFRKWSPGPGGGGGGTPSLPDRSVQFNNGGFFGGSTNFTWSATDVLAVTGSETVTRSVSDATAGIRQAITVDATQTVGGAAAELRAVDVTARYTGPELNHSRVYGVNSTVLIDTGGMSNGFAIGLLGRPDYSGTGSVLALTGVEARARNLSTGTVASAVGANNRVDNSAGGTLTFGVGNQVVVRNLGAGVATNLHGVTSSVTNTGAGSVGDMRGFSTTAANSGGGTVTTAYGVYIDSSYNAAATTVWSVYSATTAQAFFAGPIRFGSTTGPRQSAGTGSPEGVVTAPPGSLYMDDGGALYLKSTGVGNTGWVLMSSSSSTPTIQNIAAAGPTAITDTMYTVALVNFAGATAVVLPAHAAGKQIVVKDTSGAANTNNITITATAGNIDGAASQIIATIRGSMSFVSDGANWWVY